MKIVKNKWGDDFELSTGKIFSANCGFLGINPDLEISEGYDGHLFMEHQGARTRLKPNEKKEIAEFVIELWKKWAGIA